MKKSSRYIFISVGTVTWMILTTSFVCAQNFSGIVPLNSPSAASNNVAEENKPFASISLRRVNPTEDVSIRDSIGVPAFSEESSNYTLGKEDVIEISVARHPEVSGLFIINGEGKIQYQFIGDILVEGLKKVEIKDLLSERLSEFIISPNVTVKIVGYNSKIVYVIGEVHNPGKIYMRGDTITVREALVQAGLPLLTGKVTDSRLITPSDKGKVEKKIVNIHKLLYEGDLRENLIMKPGDTLYIPPTFMAKALRIIQPVAAPINAASSTGRRVYTGGF